MNCAKFEKAGKTWNVKKKKKIEKLFLKIGEIWNMTNILNVYKRHYFVFRVKKEDVFEILPLEIHLFAFIYFYLLSLLKSRLDCYNNGH